MYYNDFMKRTSCLFVLLSVLVANCFGQSPKFYAKQVSNVTSIVGAARASISQFTSNDRIIFANGRGVFENATLYNVENVYGANYRVIAANSQEFAIGQGPGATHISVGMGQPLKSLASELNFVSDYRLTTLSEDGTLGGAAGFMPNVDLFAYNVRTKQKFFIGTSSSDETVTSVSSLNLLAVSSFNPVSYNRDTLVYKNRQLTEKILDYQCEQLLSDGSMLLKHGSLSVVAVKKANQYTYYHVADGVASSMSATGLVAYKASESPSPHFIGYGGLVYELASITDGLPVGSECLSSYVRADGEMASLVRVGNQTFLYRLSAVPEPISFAGLACGILCLARRHSKRMLPVLTTALITLTIALASPTARPVHATSEPNVDKILAIPKLGKLVTLQDGLVGIFDPKLATRIYQFPEQNVSDIDYQHDRLVICQKSLSTATIYDTITLLSVATIQLQIDRPTLSLNGQRLTGIVNGAAFVYDIPTAQMLPFSQISKANVLNNEGSKLAISKFGAIEVYDVSTSQLISSIAAIGTPSVSKLSKDGKRFYCGFNYGRTYCVSTETNQLLWKSLEDKTNHIEEEPYGSAVLVCGDYARLYNSAIGSLITKVEDGFVCAAAYLGEDLYYNIQTLQENHELRRARINDYAHPEAVGGVQSLGSGLALCKTRVHGRYLFKFDADDELGLQARLAWVDPHTREVETILSGAEAEDVQSAAYSSKLDRLYIGRKFYMDCYQGSTMTKVASWVAHANSVAYLALNGNQDKLWSVGQDHIAKTWNPVTLQMVKQYSVDTSTGDLCARLSSDGTRLAVYVSKFSYSGPESAVSVYDAESGVVVSSRTTTIDQQTVEFDDSCRYFAATKPSYTVYDVDSGAFSGTANKVFPIASMSSNRTFLDVNENNELLQRDCLDFVTKRSAHVGTSLTGNGHIDSTSMMDDQAFIVVGKSPIFYRNPWINVGVSVRVYTKLQGYVGNLSGLSAWMTIRKKSGATVYDGPVSTRGNTEFSVHLDNLQRETFDITFKCGSGLAKSSLDIDCSAGTAVLDLNLLNGDVNGDNIVSTDDYLLLSHAFDSTPVDDNWLAAADLTGDGYVGTDDYLILNDNFDLVGD